MTAVFKWELKGFFTSPLGYVVLALMLVFEGYFFYYFNLSYGMSNLYHLFSQLFMIVLLVLPILTMRIFSEENKQRTNQAFLTAPVRLSAVVVGKFLSVLTVFAISLSVTLIFALILAGNYAAFDWMTYCGNLLGTLLLGGLILSIGVFLSSLTESQVIAAITTIAVSVALMLIGSLGSLFSSFAWLVSVVDFLSVNTRYSTFMSGLIHYDDVFFFLSLQALFLFLTVRVLDRKRWA